MGCSVAVALNGPAGCEPELVYSHAWLECNEQFQVTACLGSGIDDMHSVDQ